MKKSLIVILALAFGFAIKSNGQDFQKFIRFPLQDLTKINYCQAQIISKNDQLLCIYGNNNSPTDTIFISSSTDNGITWNKLTMVTSYSREKEEKLLLSALVTKTGRIIIVYSIGEVPTQNKTKYTYSDDGINWSSPSNVISTAYISYPKLTETIDGKLWIVGRSNYFFVSTNNGTSWSSKNIGFTNSIYSSYDMISLDSLNYLTLYDKYNSNFDNYSIYIRKSTNSGDTWGDEILISEVGSSERRPRVFQDLNGTISLVTQIKTATPFTTTNGIYEENICIRKSSDNGEIWSLTAAFTNYWGFDGLHNLFRRDSLTYVTFWSDRWLGRNQIWLGQLEVTRDDDTPPVLYKLANSTLIPNVPILIQAFVGSPFGIQNVALTYEFNNIINGPFTMFDDGNHMDGVAGDNIWGYSIGTFDNYDSILPSISITDNNSKQITFTCNTLTIPAPPIDNRWLSVGSLHNWYSSMGSEIEEGFEKIQQYGLQWDAISPNQDIQAAKSLWIGTENFTDQAATFYPYKVVHVGPRVSGEGEFFPKEFKVISKYEQPLVTVNGTFSNDKWAYIDKIDPDLIADRMIVNKVNTQLGIEMTRRIFQFSQKFNDNYIISEYTFKNTGNVNGDPNIELPNTTLIGVYFYYQFRLAVCANTGNAIGNGTRWGMNTMNDARGDGSINTANDSPNESFRAQYVWHGKFPPFTQFDNIGGPLWYAAYNVDPADTVGRLGAAQFAGVVTLHADISAIDKNDDASQPKTTSWEGSDEPLTSNNSAYDIQKMTQEYTNWMTRGHRSPRHALMVEPTGLPGFLQPTNDPALGTPGGFSFANGYGPYTLAPGDSVTLVFAEAVSGISRELATKTGIKYKRGQISALEKNQVVFQGRDSLFQTFRNVIENYKSGYLIPRAPKPPLTFTVNSDSYKVTLSWTIDESNPPSNFRVYRTSNRRYNNYEMMAELSADSRQFIDYDLKADTLYYYYLTCVGDDQPGGIATPAGRLESSRFYTQTYDPVFIYVTTEINDLNEIVNTFSLNQNFPNPFNPSTIISWQSPVNGYQTLKVYDMLGREVTTLVNEYRNAGKYEIEFDASQLASGIYFYHLTVSALQSKDGNAGEYRSVKKMVLVK